MLKWFENSNIRPFTGGCEEEVNLDILKGEHMPHTPFYGGDWRGEAYQPDWEYTGEEEPEGKCAFCDAETDELFRFGWDEYYMCPECQQFA